MATNNNKAAGSPTIQTMNGLFGGQQNGDFGGGQHGGLGGGQQSNSLPPQLSRQLNNGFNLPTANDDVIFGSPNADKYNGLAGNDSLDGGAGNDSLDGSAGNDTINGGEGKDVLSGGTGKDTFTFSVDDSTAEKAGRDIIKDFKSGVDKIDLSDLLNAPAETIDVVATTSTADAASTTTSTTTAANDAAARTAINFLGSAQFSDSDATGQARLEKGVLYVSTNADSEAEFSVQLTGVTSLTIDDFIF